MILILFFVLILASAFLHLEEFPPLWWDEGWNLSVARNWVERGHYGRFLAGEPIAGGLEATFPTTGLIGISFHLFGVGIWQGRLVGILCTIAALGLMYYLALRLYNRSVAWTTLFVILLLTPDPNTHCIYMGRQALAEMPMLFYLLAGYALFWLALNRSAWFLGLAIAFWGISLISKAQAVPFWVVSLLIPLLLASSRKKWRVAALFAFGMAGSLVLFQLARWFQEFIRPGYSVAPLKGIYDVTALVFEGDSRLFALKKVIESGLPALLSLALTTYRFLRKETLAGFPENIDLMRIALLGLGMSYLIWYMALSVGFGRYLLPPLFISSIFVAATLYDLTNRFDFRSTLSQLTEAFRNRQYNQKVGGILLSFLMVISTVGPAIKYGGIVWQNYFANAGQAMMKTVQYLHGHTPPDSLIETYESEIHFLLNRKVHYPPDQVHVELNRRTFLGQNVPIPYDPLAQDPDYLVVGFQARMWGLYHSVVAKGAFRLVQWYPPYYFIFERVR